MDILVEQVVYGSFPFWDRGYDVLARSPGCRPEWVADLLAACQKFGEAPSGVSPAACLFSVRLASGPWAIVGVGPQGSDDRGRPGALAFHALLVSGRDYRRAGSDPFPFAGALRRDWSAEDRSLDACFWTIEGPRTPGLPADPRAGRVAAALIRRRRVALESAGPIDSLAREVWASLPGSVRRRASVATWAFGNGNRFDLVAIPRLAGVALDGSYVDPASIDSEPAAIPGRLPLYKEWVGTTARARRGLAVGGLTVAVAAGLAWWATGPREPAGTPAASGPAGDDLAIGPEERARVVAGLEGLAARFEAFEVGRADDPADLMARFADRVRYRGPTLSVGELTRLAAEADPDRDRALAWHDRIRAFVADVPWPDDFARAPLPEQLDRLARSYHLEPPSRADDVPGALAEALSRDGPIRPTPLAARYPALSDYARFLGRLPRRGEK